MKLLKHRLLEKRQRKKYYTEPWRTDQYYMQTYYVSYIVAEVSGREVVVDLEHSGFEIDFLQDRTGLECSTETFLRLALMRQIEDILFKGL